MIVKKNYVVERLEPTPFGLTSNNRESDKPKTRKKKDNSSSLGFGNVSFWGSDSDTKKKTKKKSTTKKKTTKKKTTDIWGSSSTKKKSTGIW